MSNFSQQGDNQFETVREAFQRAHQARAQTTGRVRTERRRTIDADRYFLKPQAGQA